MICFVVGTPRSSQTRKEILIHLRVDMTHDTTWEERVMEQEISLAIQRREAELREKIEALNWHEDFEGGLRKEWLRRSEVLKLLTT